MLIRGLNEKEVVEKGLADTEVWYVINLTIDGVVGFPEQTEDTKEIKDVGDPYFRITPVFVEKEHAETVKYHASKNAYAQGHKFDLESEPYKDISERVKNHPEFSLQFYDSETGEKFLKELEDLRITKEFEEKRNEELKGKTLDELYELED